MIEGVIVANEKWYSFRELSIDQQKDFVRAKRAEGFAEKDFYKLFGIVKETWGKWVKATGMWRNGHACPQEAYGAMRSDTLCWQCKNACGGCSWSHYLEPVEGWTVEETAGPEWIASLQKMVPSVTVKECPEFIKG